MNTLLAGVCVFIPFVGPIVIKGWLLTGFWGRQDERFETFPDFDFNNFGKYLERGLWPFLVMFASSLIIAFVLCLFVVPVVMLLSLMIPQTNSAGSSCAGLAIFGVLFVFYVVAIVTMLVVLTPLTLRASLTQEFGAAFDFTFMKRFIALAWKEIVLASLFQLVASFLLSLGGLLLVCVGVYFATVPIYFCWVHLHKQLYQVYLSRGGEPVPISPKLQDYPPPAPV